MEEVYGRTQQLRKEGGFGKCKESSSKIQKENKCRSWKIGKVKNGKRKGL